jgi:hypothetical protein
MNAGIACPMAHLGIRTAGNETNRDLVTRDLIAWLDGVSERAVRQLIIQHLRSFALSACLSKTLRSKQKSSGSRRCRGPNTKS